MTLATKPYAYSGFVLKPRPDGSQDLIDPATGRWATYSTQRHARWTATVVNNFLGRMEDHAPLPQRQIPKPAQEN